MLQYDKQHRELQLLYSWPKSWELILWVFNDGGCDAASVLIYYLYDAALRLTHTRQHKIWSIKNRTTTAIIHRISQFSHFSLFYWFISVLLSLCICCLFRISSSLCKWGAGVHLLVRQCQAHNRNGSSTAVREPIKFQVTFIWHPGHIESLENTPPYNFYFTDAEVLFTFLINFHMGDNT